LKKFIDDVSILDIKHCHIRKLPRLFSLEIVYDLTDEDVRGLVENDETAAEWARYVEKLMVLKVGLLDLKRL
jgi:hypothetical protein